MKKSFPLVVLCAAAILSVSFVQPRQVPNNEGKVHWYTWSEAVELNKKTPKKIYVDIYTTWCGPCKKMDMTTFENPEVAAYLNEHFYPVKFDAEQKEPLVYDGHVFKHLEGGRHGINEFAYSILDQKLLFPSGVFLDEAVQRTTIMPGYMEPVIFMKVLKFHAENHYKTMSWDDYKKTNG